ncbi:MAG: hypothetical protein K2Q20_10440 [Phycisphaerales bacterium]|nr:hypothetical protein [Phycisphaerales bacterium]
MSLTTEQVASLDAFHTTTLADGTLRFEMAHPRTGLTHEFRFASDGIEWSEPANGLYRTAFDLEYLA